MVGRCTKNAVAVCATFTIYWLMVKHLTSADSVWSKTLNINSLLQKTKRASFNSTRKSFQTYIWDVRCVREKLENRDTRSRSRRITRTSRCRTPCEMNQRERSVVTERDKFIFSCANGMIQLSGTKSEVCTPINGKDPKRLKNTTVIIQDKKTAHLILQKIGWKRRVSSGVFLEALSADTMCKQEQKLQVPQEAHFRYH